MLGRNSVSKAMPDSTSTLQPSIATGRCQRPCLSQRVNYILHFASSQEKLGRCAPQLGEGGLVAGRTPSIAKGSRRSIRSSVSFLPSSNSDFSGSSLQGVEQGMNADNLVQAVRQDAQTPLKRSKKPSGFWNPNLSFWNPAARQEIIHAPGTPREGPPPHLGRPSRS